MRDVLIKLDDSTTYDIMIESLYSGLRVMVDNLKIRQDNPSSIPVFDNDLNKDIGLIKYHIDCFKTILRYYGEQVD